MCFQSQVELLLPVAIGDYSDFFTSLHHTKNCGIIFRGPENPVLENWCVEFYGFSSQTSVFFFVVLKNERNLVRRYHLPVAYHGRASSVVVSGTDIIRPRSEVFF